MPGMEGYEKGKSFEGLKTDEGCKLQGIDLQTVYVYFDRGTLLLSSSPSYENLIRNLPGVLRDNRTESYRAPARFYSTIYSDLRKKGYIKIKTNIRHVRLTQNRGRVPLRSYQEMALREWVSVGKRGIISLPTGSGKTYIALAAIEKLKLSTLCLVPTRILLHQWFENVKRYYAGPTGIVGDGKYEIHPITICTFESAYRYISRFGNKFDLLIIDEVHHFGSGLRDEILEMSTAPFRMGLTATPPEDPACINKLSSILGPQVFNLSINDLSGKYLCEYEFYQFYSDLNEKERINYRREIQVFTNFLRKKEINFNVGSWSALAKIAHRTEEGRRALSSLRRATRIAGMTESKIKALVKILSHHRDDKILIFTADRASVYYIAGKFMLMPVTSDIKKAERDRIFKAYRDGKINTIVSCRVLNEGIDVPEASVAIITGGNMGYREHVQRIGRILRPGEGKKAIIYELISSKTLEVRKALKRSRDFDTRVTLSI